MSGYDPFRYADNYESEEEYMKELEEENKMTKKIEIDLDAITKRRDELMDLEARYKFELKQVTKEMETLDLQLIALLSQTGTDSMDYGIYSWEYKDVQRTALDQKMLKEKYLEVFNDCYVTKTNKKFNFSINKYGK